MFPFEKIKSQAVEWVCAATPSVSGWLVRALWKTSYSIPGFYLTVLVVLACLMALLASAYNGMYLANSLPDGLVGAKGYLVTIAAVGLASMGVFFFFLFKDLALFDSWGQSLVHEVGRAVVAINKQ
ncbi:hypothetical protein [Streptomyces sp. GbtcB6]|uniref:hypothetical protein n=1 Tax=Streptomyces sp. GbtcB6 TaxID=2824751 RepID=UPI001C2F92F1|nr:hypothetical protein [Streptomyces sp. GbtcB6]